MIKKQLSVLLIIIFAFLFSGCTLEDETAEKIIQNKQIIVSEPTLQDIFKELCFNCSLGKADNYDEIVSLYYSTLNEKDARFAKKTYSFLGNSSVSDSAFSRSIRKCSKD